MKCRITYTLTGTCYGVPAGDGGVSLRRGQIIDLPTADVARLVGLGQAELRLEGELGQPLRPSAEDLAKIEAILATEQPPGALHDLRAKIGRSRNAG